MKISTDDGLFGFVLAPLSGAGMFRFQMIVGGRLIGDTEACILGSAMYRLSNLRRLADERLGRVFEEPGAVVSALCTNDGLHDAATLSLAESLDRWRLHGYVHDGKVNVLAQGYNQSGEVEGLVLASVVNVPEYELMIETVRHYWQHAEARKT